MMAAAALIESNAHCTIHLFEPNTSLGVKVVISGGGRCNVTTGIRKPHILKKKYTRGGDFLKAALSKFGPEAVYNWFEDRGVPLKTEDDLRVFPRSNDGKDVVAVFDRLFAQSTAQLHFKSRVKTITNHDDHFWIRTKDSKTPVDYVVIATGGNAYRKTGSTGDGYQFAEYFGHTITPLGPSLNSFLTKEDWSKLLSGIALPHAKIYFGNTNIEGPFLFTHFGISGPLTFAFSSHIAHTTITKENPYVIRLVLDATIQPHEWKTTLGAVKTNGKKQIKTVLSTYFPQRLAQTLLELTNISPQTTLTAVSTEKRKQLLHLLTNGIQITLTARRAGDEFVTAGGVSTDEINPQTMESLLQPGLYFAGEVMDIDGVTGGFNLQSSWATGRLAGQSIAKKLRRPY